MTELEKVQVWAKTRQDFIEADSSQAAILQAWEESGLTEEIRSDSFERILWKMGMAPVVVGSRFRLNFGHMIPRT